MILQTTIREAYKALGLPTDPASISTAQDQLNNQAALRAEQIESRLRTQWIAENPASKGLLPGEIMEQTAREAMRRAEEEILEENLNAQIRNANTVINVVASE